MSLLQAQSFLGVPLKRDANNAIELSLSNFQEIERRISVDSSYNADPAEKMFKDDGGKILGLNEMEMSAILWEIKKSNSIRGVIRNDAQTLANFVFTGRGTLKNFYDWLMAGKPQLVNDMVDYLDKGSNAGHQLSWCSKICKYLEFWENWQGDLNYQNKFSVYDKFVRIVLPYYFDIFGIKKADGGKWTPDDLENKKICAHYENYDGAIQQLLDCLRSKKDAVSTKYQLDHLLWYHYRQYDSKLLTRAVNALINA